MTIDPTSRDSGQENQGTPPGGAPAAAGPDARPQGRENPFVCATRGFFEALRTERHLRFHCIFAIVALLLCVILRVELWGWIAVIIMIALVISAELINTSIEATVDIVSPDFSPLARRAKDVGASAVLFLAICSVVVGGAIYIHALMRLIG